MRFELGLERPNPRRAPISATTIAISYIVGGLIPLLPYILGLELHQALLYSVVFTGIALALFGAVKGRLTESTWPSRRFRRCSSAAWRPAPLSIWRRYLVDIERAQFFRKVQAATQDTACSD